MVDGRTKHECVEGSWLLSHPLPTNFRVPRTRTRDHQKVNPVCEREVAAFTLPVCQQVWRPSSIPGSGQRWRGRAMHYRDGLGAWGRMWPSCALARLG